MLDYRQDKMDVSRIHLVSRYMVKTDPGTGKPYSGVVEVTYVPDGLVFEPISFEERLVSNCRGSLRPDALARMIFVDIQETINPSSLSVTVHVETTAHGSLAITIEWEDQ